MQNVLPAPTGIDPVAFANKLENAYPNPFNPTTTIKYSIASAGRVTLKIYNAAGQLVRTLVDDDQAPQPEGFAVVWDGLSDRGQSVATGVYFYKLTTKEFSDTKKMACIK
jgi:flagellar hook assembly protein FlgD